MRVSTLPAGPFPGGLLAGRKALLLVLVVESEVGAHWRKYVTGCVFEGYILFLATRLALFVASCSGGSSAMFFRYEISTSPQTHGHGASQPWAKLPEMVSFLHIR